MGGQQNDGQDQKNDVSLLRQQAENLAFAAHQSLVDLSESQAECLTDSEQPNGTDSDDKSETTSQLQVQVYKRGQMTLMIGYLTSSSCPTLSRARIPVIRSRPVYHQIQQYQKLTRMPKDFLPRMNAAQAKWQ